MLSTRRYSQDHSSVGKGVYRIGQTLRTSALIFLFSVIGTGLSFAKKPKMPKLITIKYSKAKKGKKPGCSSKFPKSGKWGKAFFHLGNLSCYSCPKGYKRTIDPNVKGKRACRKPSKVRHARAKYEGKGKKKGLRVKCRRGFRHRLTRRCYSCPKGYKRSVHNIKSRKACAKRTKARYARAKKRGKPGCKKGYFRHGLFNACYSCPKGYKRSLSLAVDLSKNKKACVKVQTIKGYLRNPKFVRTFKPKIRAFKRKYAPLIRRALILSKNLSKGKSFKGMAWGSRKKRTRAIRRAFERANGVKIFTPMARNTKDSSLKGNGDTCTSNSECASNNCKSFNGSKICIETNTIKSITVGIPLDISAIIGGTFTPIMLAWDLTGGKRGNKKAVPYYAWAWSIGTTLGGDVGVEVGFWVDANNALSGASHGLVVGASYKGGAAMSFWWSYDRSGSGANGKKQKVRFLGFTIIPQGGLSGEIEYSRAITVRHKKSND